MIRSVTIGLPIQSRSRVELQSDLKLVDSAIAKIGIQSRTRRLTLPPAQLDVESTPGALRSMVESVRKLAELCDARWYCLPISLFERKGRDALLSEAQALLLRESKLFVNLVVAQEGQVCLDGAEAAAKFIVELSRRGSNGVDNFRVGVSSQCLPQTPFFPFSRHEGEETKISFAMETTPTALRLAQQAKDDGLGLKEFQLQLIAALRHDVEEVDELGRRLEAESGVTYAGLDASYAPFPDGQTSVARLLELLGVSPLGAHGSVFLTSLLTDALKVALSGVRTTGFNGVMYSVLEDEGLARSNDWRALNLSKLVTLSTVCGCGVDMVPLPGNLFADDVTGLILDVAALSVRLDKPLGVRVLPIPKLAVNEFTAFNMDFLCDSRVMDPGVGSPLHGLADIDFSYETAKDSEND